MINFKLKHVICRITLVVLMLTIVNIPTGSAQENISKREARRNSVPVDKLINNLENPKKELEKQSERVLDVFGVKKGDRLADVGAGTGLLALKMASRVGIEGKVYAVEIEDELLNVIRAKIAKTKTENIIPIKSSETDANLPLECCNKMMLIGTYYYLEDPVIFMSNLRKSLNLGGLVGIINLDAAKAKAKTKKSFVPASKVIDEMKRAGYVLRESHNFLEFRYFLVFSAI